jgi:hypothetical protein
MFIFNLFEKKKQDAAAGRFVGGTSQDARVKNALDNAYRAVPAAKSPEEAALGYIDIQNSLNQKQDQVLDQQTKTNQQQTQQINDLVGDMRRKEKDFRDLNAQIANMPNVTPQQVAKMAQDIEAAHDSGKDQAVDVPSVIAKQTTAQPAKKVAAPSPGASISQLANYQQAKDQGAATAKAQPAAPQATPAPAVTPPGRVIKGKNQSNALGQMAQQLTTQPAQQELPVNNVRNIDQARAAKAAAAKSDAERAATLQASGLGTGTLGEQATGAGNEQIAGDNEARLVKAYLGDTSVELVFLTGPVLPLNKQQVHAFVDAFAQIPAGPNKDALKTNLFSNRTFLIEWLFENIVNPATATNRPTDVDQNELNQGQLTLEGDVVPMTQDQSVLQAYNDVLEILKASKTKQPDVVTMMRQDWAGRYKQRFQISTAPDGTYYMLDKTTNQRHRLPDPRTFPMEEDAWHNGQNSWSSEHDQWAKESVEEDRLSVGDPVVVTAPNEYEGKTGEISEFSPSGKFVIVNLYNYGEHSMHLSDVEYNKYADDELDEGADSNPVAGAITRRILMQRLDLLKQYGPELVGAAVDNVADYVGDVDEIGSSDVSAWVTQVERMLKENPPEAFAEGWSDAVVAQRTGQPRTPYSVYIKGKKWKDFENDDHAEAVANKLRAKFEREGRDPGVITIAPTDMSEGVAEVADQTKKVFKDKSGKPVGEIGIDPESSPGNGEWYVHHYATGYSVVGFDSAAEAKRELLYVHKHPDAVDGHPSTKEQGVAEAGSPAQQAAIAVAMKKAGKKPKNESDDGDWVDDPTAHAQVNRSGFNKLTPQSYADKIDFIDRQLADPRQQQNWPEFKQRRLDLMTAAQRAGIVKEQDRVTEIKKGQKDSNGYTKCWSGYHAAGTKKSATTGKQVRNCVPNEGVAEDSGEYKVYYMTAEDHKLMGRYASREEAEQRLNQLQTEYPDNKFIIWTNSKQGVAEVATDYSKRRDRERKVDAGQPVSRQPKNPQTDYAKKRAKDKHDMELGESTNYWTRLQNERNTKIASLVSELTESIEKK